MNIILVIGTRPNFIKAYAILRAAKRRNINIKLIHTGQHYDYSMNKIFFDELDIVSPEYNLNIKAKDKGEFVGKCIQKLDEIFIIEKPDLIIAVGDVNSSLAATIAAKMLNITVAHVEAGLRSFDKQMPEEINRIIIDSISDLFFITEPAGMTNLTNEGHEDNLYLVGNTMIDTLFTLQNRIKKNTQKQFRKFDIKDKQYALVTIHRQGNVDLVSLRNIINCINTAAKNIKVIFPIHPRTKKQIGKLSIKFNDKVTIVDPLGYIDFITLLSHAKMVITDSGGIQEESMALKIPCIVLRNTTERPVTLPIGINTLVGQNKHDFSSALNNILQNNIVLNTYNLWDGKASDRIINILIEYFQGSLIIG